MPSLIHHATLTLLRTRPDLLASIMEPCGFSLGPDVQEFGADATPSAPAARTADLVLGPFFGPDEDPTLVVVEVQLSADPNKRWTWPSYLAHLRDRHRMSTVLVVVAPTEAIARWAQADIRLGHPGLVLRPLVLGPADVPLVLEPSEVAKFPEKAVLSAIFHGQGPHATALGLASVEGLLQVDTTVQLAYVDIVLASLSGSARQIVEAIMVEKTEFFSAFFQRAAAEGHQKGWAEGIENGLLKGWNTGRAVGREEGREEGRQEGREDGREDGRQREARRLLALLLNARFPQVDWAPHLALAAAASTESLESAFTVASTAQEAESCELRVRAALAGGPT